MIRLAPLGSTSAMMSKSWPSTLIGSGCSGVIVPGLAVMGGWRSYSSSLIGSGEHADAVRGVA